MRKAAPAFLFKSLVHVLSLLLAESTSRVRASIFRVQQSNDERRKRVCLGFFIPSAASIPDLDYHQKVLIVSNRLRWGRVLERFPPPCLAAVVLSHDIGEDTTERLELPHPPRVCRVVPSTHHPTPLRVKSNPRWLSSIYCHFSLKRYESSLTPCNWQMVISERKFLGVRGGIARRSRDRKDYDMKQRLQLNCLFLLSFLLYLIGRYSTCSGM